MAKSAHSTVSFAGGVVSPKLDARVDQQKYGTWSRQMLNMVPYKTGGMTRRVGTQFMGSPKYPTGLYAVRTMPFIYSPDTTFELEMGHQYIRFWSNGAQVQVSSAPLWISGTTYPPGSFATSIATPGTICYTAGGVVNSTTDPVNDPTNWVLQTIYEVPSPYSGTYSAGTQPQTADVFGVVPCQINDVVYMVHPDYPPYSLTQLGTTDWTMEETPFLSPALLDQNATDTMITPSALQGTGITLTASAPAWSQANYYSLANSVEYGGIIYDCILANVSSASFGNDLVAGWWKPVGIFNPLHAGADWQLAVLRPSAYTTWGADVAGAQSTAAHGFYAGTSNQIQCLGAYEVHSYGVWSADIAIQRSLDGGQSWDTVQSFSGRSDRNVDLSGTSILLGIYRIVVSNVAVPINPGATAPRVVFECEDAFLYGLVEITAVTTLAASAMVNGNVYQIQTLGTTNWTSLGVANQAFVGTIFQYTGGAVTGSGGIVFHPYVATASVLTQLTDSNQLDAQWVSGATYIHAASSGGCAAGQTYVIVTQGTTNWLAIGALSNAVGTVFLANGSGSGTGTCSSVASYAFANYTCSSGTSGTTIPPLDGTHWALSTPGGTEYWSEGAWSDYRGYPQAVCSYQQRVWYASSGYEPQRLWGTVTNDIQNFALGDQTLATDAVVFDLNAPGRGPIVWLIAQTDLFAGFSGAEWVINSGSVSGTGVSTGAAITPSNVNAVEQGTFGSAPEVQPAIVGNAVFYAQRQADAIRQMLFSVYTAKYMSQDLSTLADHLFASGIVQIAYQPRWRHQGIIWCVTQQGTIAGLTYDLEQEVFGWFEAQTGYGQTSLALPPGLIDNGFESVSVIDGQGNADDEVWLVANRQINGTATRSIERMNPVNWEEIFAGPPNPPGPVLADAFYVDCGVTVTNPGTLQITGLSNLNGRYVYGLADGAPFGPLLVNADAAQLPSYIPTTVGVVQIGLPIYYAGQVMRFDIDPRMGNTQGLVKAVSDVYIRVWNSLGGNIGNGTVQTPTWVSGTNYSVGQTVLSSINQGAYQCVTAYNGTTDPSASSSWVSVPKPPYNAPTPIPYTPTPSNPAVVPVLVTKPTDIRVTPMLTPRSNDDDGTDPQIIVQGNDALPLTVLGYFLKYDITGNPQ